MEEDQEKFSAFKGASLADWVSVAQDELKGANPLEKLRHVGEGWSILPYYDQNTDKPPAPLLHPAQNTFLGPRTWYNCPSLKVEDPAAANLLALEYLRQGADGILFELQDKVSMEALLRDIDWKYCSLNFLAKKNPETVAANLHDFILNKNYSNIPLHGAFFGNLLTEQLPNGAFHFGGHQLMAASSPAEEIASGFIRLIGQGQRDLAQQAHQVAMSINVGTDFFLEVSKIRALRVTWNSFLAATRSRSDIPLFIHARSLPWTDAGFAPHATMIKNTTAAMAAILGGCDALTIDPEKDDHGMMSRVARNVSNVLREESHFSKVADPVAGSYLLENLTSQLAEASWKIIAPNLPA